MTMKKTLIASAVMVSIFIAPAAFAFKEYPAGEPVTMNEMELAAVYLQPIDMEPRGMGLPAAKADVHLEADIHAVEGNKNGFGAGEWIPYLTISYTWSTTTRAKNRKAPSCRWLPAMARTMARTSK